MNSEISKMLSNCVADDVIKKNVENDPIFNERFKVYADLVMQLNNDFVKLTNEKLKESYINELTIILIIIKLLKKHLKEKNCLIDLDKILTQFDKNQLFTCYNDHIFDEIHTDNLPKIYFTNEDIINIFNIRQTIEDKKLFGQYYTPNNMIDHVIKMLNLDTNCLKKYRISDPACGSGVFLVKLIDLFFEYNNQIEDVCEFANNQIFGYDINPAAIFLCKLSIYLRIVDHYNDSKDYEYIANNIKLNNIINTNTIFTNPDEKFDIILGNPPYFKIRNEVLDTAIEYKKILNGQGNIYALFMQWSLLNIKDKGAICLIVPQSIRSGKYFKKIRMKLCEYSLKQLLSIDSKKRNQVFLDAEQAILIILLEKRHPSYPKTKVKISYDGIHVKDIGEFEQSNILSSEALAVPIDTCSYKLFLRIKNSFPKFQDVEPDLTFGNGLFVWNQNKQYLSFSCQNSFPIIYANYITENNFIFDEEKNNIDKVGARRAFCIPNDNCKNFICTGRKLIIKRTSGIENFIRIKPSIISVDFLDQYPKYYLENHVNFLYNKKDKNIAIPIEKLLYISAYLSSDIANFIFKLMNGNTQVSAIELNTLPFIYKHEKEIISLMKRKSINLKKVNEIFFQIFDLSVEEIQTIKNYKAGFSK